LSSTTANAGVSTTARSEDKKCSRCGTKGHLAEECRTNWKRIKKQPDGTIKLKPKERFRKRTQVNSIEDEESTRDDETQECHAVAVNQIEMFPHYDEFKIQKDQYDKIEVEYHSVTFYQQNVDETIMLESWLTDSLATGEQMPENQCLTSSVSVPESVNATKPIATNTTEVEIHALTAFNPDQKNIEILLDNGANRHLSPDVTLFKNLVKKGKATVKTANKVQEVANITGDIYFELIDEKQNIYPITLKSVVFLPGLERTILSVNLFHQEYLHEFRPLHNRLYFTRNDKRAGNKYYLEVPLRNMLHVIQALATCYKERRINATEDVNVNATLTNVVNGVPLTAQKLGKEKNNNVHLNENLSVAEKQTVCARFCKGYGKLPLDKIKEVE
jgi:hypothetical protein